LGTLTIVGSEVSGNEVTGQVNGYGGGIYNSGSMDSSEITFENNLVTHRGGGLYNAGTATIANANFNENQADKGGGLANAGSLTLERASVTRNLALTLGGGIFLNGDLTGNMLSFIGNHAQSDGGAIFLDPAGSLNLERSNIATNLADGFGGGMYLDNEATAIFNKGSLIENRSSTGTSAIYMRGPLGATSVSGRATSLSMTNVTLSGNHSTLTSQPALFASSGTSVLLDSVTIFSNKDIGLFAAGTGTIILHNTILASSGIQNCSGEGLVSSGGNLDTDGSCHFAGSHDQTGLDPLLLPLIPDAWVGQVHPLDAGSPAIDAAGAACPAIDQRGITRPQEMGCDSGAYEYSSALAVGTPDPYSSAAPIARPTGPVTCRSGPSTVYPPTAYYSVGQELRLQSRDGNASWLEVQEDGKPPCWLKGDLVEVEHGFNLMDLQPGIIPPTPVWTPVPPAEEPDTGSQGCKYYDGQQNIICYPIGQCPVAFEDSLGACTP